MKLRSIRKRAFKAWLVKRFDSFKAADTLNCLDGAPTREILIPYWGGIRLNDVYEADWLDELRYLKSKLGDLYCEALGVYMQFVSESIIKERCSLQFAYHEKWKRLARSYGCYSYIG